MIWLKFLLCLVVIWLAGARLSRYGDIIAEKTGMGRNWVGLIMLATVTSLPELVTGISAVTVAVFLYERHEMAEYVGEVVERYPGIELRQAFIGYALAASAVVVAGVWLPFVGEEIAVTMGWHDSFVGTLLIAAATSTPEIAVTVAAVRMGALDMAIANLLGSNLFNIMIVAVDDLFYLKGPILAQVSPAHAVSAFSAIIMTGIAIVGLCYRPTGRLRIRVGWISVFLLAIYLINSYVLFEYGD
jgi:cation:H+ antiporter